MSVRTQARMSATSHLCLSLYTLLSGFSILSSLSLSNSSDERLRGISFHREHIFVIFPLFLICLFGWREDGGEGWKTRSWIIWLCILISGEFDKEMKSCSIHACLFFLFFSSSFVGRFLGFFWKSALNFLLFLFVFYVSLEPNEGLELGDRRFWDCLVSYRDFFSISTVLCFSAVCFLDFLIFGWNYCFFLIFRFFVYAW